MAETLGDPAGTGDPFAAQAPMLEIGSGEELMASRLPALSAWESSAVGRR
jgi:hypothetical protein